MTTPAFANVLNVVQARASMLAGVNKLADAVQVRAVSVHGNDVATLS